jgi:hypothetical protein
MTDGREAPTDARAFLRHAVATLAYRGGKAVRGAPDSFAAFHLAATSRTPVQILAHVGDLLDWALSIAQGRQRWNDSRPLPWDQEVARFHAALAALDDYLASEAPLGDSPGRVFQGPIADALTHVGQINLLRRLAGAPVRGENYHRAHIETGRVGAEQPAPVREFD